MIINGSITHQLDGVKESIRQDSVGLSYAAAVVEKEIFFLLKVTREMQFIR